MFCRVDEHLAWNWPSSLLHLLANSFEELPLGILTKARFALFSVIKHHLLKRKLLLQLEV